MSTLGLGAILLTVSEPVQANVTFETLTDLAEQKSDHPEGDASSDPISDLLHKIPGMKDLPYVIGANSKSSQQAKKEKGLPRIITYDISTQFVFSFNGFHSPGGNTIETMQYDPEKGFLFREIAFPYDKNKAAKVNPPKCMECHGKPLPAHPIWDTYFVWAGFIRGGRDRLAPDEIEWMKTFNKMRESNPQQLPLQEQRYTALGNFEENSLAIAATVFSNSSLFDEKTMEARIKRQREVDIRIRSEPNTQFGHFLATLNEKEIVKHVLKESKFDIEKMRYKRGEEIPKDANLLRPLRYAVLGSIACWHTLPNYAEFLPKELITRMELVPVTYKFQDTKDKVNEAATDNYNRHLTEVNMRPALLDKEIKEHTEQNTPAPTPKLRYLFDIAGEQLANWGTSVSGKETYAFHHGYIGFHIGNGIWEEILNDGHHAELYNEMKEYLDHFLKNPESRPKSEIYPSMPKPYCEKLKKLSLDTIEEAMKQGYLDLATDLHCLRALDQKPTKTANIPDFSSLESQLQPRQSFCSRLFGKKPKPSGKKKKIRFFEGVDFQ